MSHGQTIDLLVQCTLDELRLAKDGRRTVIPIRRVPDGRWTLEIRHEAAAKLRTFLGRSTAGTPRRAWCILSCRGVAIRRLTLPPAKPNQRLALLQLQLEKELPLPPSAFAWGRRHQDRQLPASGPGRSEETIIAVRMDHLADLQELFESVGILPAYTVGALAAGNALVDSSGRQAVLWLGPNQSDLAVYESGSPAFVKSLPFGGRDLLKARSPEASVLPPESEGSDSVANESPLPSLEVGSLTPEQERALERHAISVAAELQPLVAGGRLWIGGFPSTIAPWRSCLEAALGSDVSCHSIPVRKKDPDADLLVPLEDAVREGLDSRWVVLRNDGIDTPVDSDPSPKVPFRWVAALGVLLLGCLALRYTGPLIRSPSVARQLETAREQWNALPAIDKELDFLRGLERMRPDYLGALAVLAEAAPRGTQVESVSFDRNGEFSFRAVMQNGQQAADLRKDLIDSGMFYQVVLEEQSMDEQKRKATVRIRGKWIPKPETAAPLIQRLESEAAKQPSTQTP